MLPPSLWSQIKAVFFDAEGTLVHITPSVGHVYAAVWEKYGLKADPAQVNRVFYQIYAQRRDDWAPTPESCFEGWREVFFSTARRFGSLKDPERAYQECYECFARKDYFRLTPGTPEILKRLKAAGLRLAVISNWDERLRRLLRALGLSAWFEEIFISCEIGLAKPDPEIYRYACGKLKVKPSQSLMIGDNLRDDVLAARRAGLLALRYPGGNLARLFPGSL